MWHKYFLVSGPDIFHHIGCETFKEEHSSDSILAQQILHGGLQVLNMHHGEARIAAGRYITAKGEMGIASVI